MTPRRIDWRASWHSWITNDLTPAGPPWTLWIWTTLFGATIAAGFTMLAYGIDAAQGGDGWRRPAGIPRVFAANLIVSLTVAYMVHALFALLVPWIGPARLRRMSAGRRAGFYIAVPLAGVIVGWPLGMWLAGDSPTRWVQGGGLSTALGGLAVALMFSAIIFFVINARAQQAVAEKRAIEAQLRLLQAQMEPHFLFNTLANLQSLLDTDVPRARELLESFTDYLRASLTTMRSGDSTWARELELADAYLRLQQLRMADRLRYSLPAAEALGGLPIPPLLLQPLVENAVLHGLEPQVDGGRVEVLARCEGDELVIEVRDDGRGLDAPPLRRRLGNGVALANLRQRLRSLYGPGDRLTLERAEPGTVARLRLPVLGCAAHDAGGCEPAPIA